MCSHFCGLVGNLDPQPTHFADDAAQPLSEIVVGLCQIAEFVMRESGHFVRQIAGALADVAHHAGKVLHRPHDQVVQIQEGANACQYARPGDPWQPLTTAGRHSDPGQYRPDRHDDQIAGEFARQGIEDCTLYRFISAPEGGRTGRGGGSMPRRCE